MSITRHQHITIVTDEHETLVSQSVSYEEAQTQGQLIADLFGEYPETDTVVMPTELLYDLLEALNVDIDP